MVFTLMVTGKTAYTGPILTLSLGKTPKRQGLAYGDGLKSAYSGFYPDNHPSKLYIL